MSSSSEEKEHNIIKKVMRDPYSLSGGDLSKYTNVHQVLQIVFCIFLGLYLWKQYHIWFVSDEKAAWAKQYWEVFHDITRVLTSTAATTGLLTMYYHLKNPTN